MRKSKVTAKQRKAILEGPHVVTMQGSNDEKHWENIPLLKQRHITHGDFSENARVMQGVKRVLRTGDNWLRFLRGAPNGLVDVQAEAIEMIVVKLGRIVTGNPNEADHWADIEGYARLARERLVK